MFISVKQVACVFILVLKCANAVSQKTANDGWLFLSHTQKLSGKVDLLADAQVRSTDKWEAVNTLLLRGGLGYNFNKEHSAAAGYVFKGDWEEENGKKNLQPEHRIYEQYLYTTTFKRTELTGRLRLEQRFIKGSGAYEFSQRTRIFISASIPLVANSDFSKGLFTTLQNELFNNVQHKSQVSNSFFDQNRSLISLGYRWNKNLDAELGYMYWYKKDTGANSATNVFQLMITTSL